MTKHGALATATVGGRQSSEGNLACCICNGKHFTVAVLRIGTVRKTEAEYQICPACLVRMVRQEMLAKVMDDD